MKCRRIFRQENYSNRKEFETKVKDCLMNDYRLSKENTDIAFSNCMAFDYAVVVPHSVDDAFYYGAIMATNIYRTEVEILEG